MLLIVIPEQMKKLPQLKEYFWEALFQTDYLDLYISFTS